MLRPTMLRYVALTFCERLAGAFTQVRKIFTAAQVLAKTVLKTEKKIAKLGSASETSMNVSENRLLHFFHFK